MTVAIGKSSTPSRVRLIRRPTLRPARLDDYIHIQRLESSHDLLTMDERTWRGLWLDNPLRDRLGNDWPIGWVLEDAAGAVVGSLANIPTLYTYKGRDLIAAAGRAWVVAPEYRGVALWLMDEYFNQPGADLFVNTSVNSMAVDPFSAFGSDRIPLGDWEKAAYWVTGYRGFARAALRIKNAPLSGLLSYPIAMALRARDVVSIKSASHGPREADSPLAPSRLSSISTNIRGTTPASIDIEQLPGFDSRFDDFWHELTDQNPEKLLGVRDARSLHWHFAGPLRAGQAWIFAATRAGLLRAYCVLKRQDHPQSGLVRMRLVDHQSLEPGRDLLSPLVRAVLRRCAAEGIHVMEHVGLGLPKMNSIDRAAPYRRKLPAWPFYYRAPDAVLHAELRDADRWDPSTFDGDASL